MVILPGNGAERFIARLRIEWTRTRAYPVTFSAGVASARPDPRKALHAADCALYRAKQMFAELLQDGPASCRQARPRPAASR